MEGEKPTSPLAAFRRGAVLRPTPISVQHLRGELYLFKPRASSDGQLSIDGNTFGDPECIKERPLLIVSRDDLNRGQSVLVVPFYSQQLDKRREFKSCVFFNAGESGLDKDCVAKCDEVGVFDRLELGGKIGRASADKMEAIVEAIRWVIRDHTLAT